MKEIWKKIGWWTLAVVFSPFLVIWFAMTWLAARLGPHMPRNRRTALAHRAARLHSAVWVAFGVSIWFPWEPLGWSIATWSVSVPLWFVLIAGNAHGRRLCESCASDFPLNAQEEADRRLPQLRAHHRYGSWVLLPLLLFWGGVSAGSALHGPWWTMPVLYDICVTGVLATAGRWRAVHMQLAPWCPWCRDDNGPDDGDAFEPVPDLDPHVKIPA